jgi:hypothetical protein
MRVFVVCCCVLVASRASAQAQTDGWEIALHVGGITAGDGPSGELMLPPTDVQRVGLSGIGSTYRVSSWYFGDGTSLLNEVVGARGRFAVVPLDTALVGSAVRQGSGLTFRAGLGRRFTPRLRGEFAVEYGGRSELTPETLATVEAARAGFEQAFTAPVLGARGTVASAAAFRAQGGNELTTTGTLAIDLGPLNRRIVPFATVGAGVTSLLGDEPSIDLNGAYQLTFSSVFSPVIADHGDAVHVDYVLPDHAFAAVLGGGARVNVGSRWFLRGELRALMTHREVTVRVNTTPRITPIPGQTSGLGLASPTSDLLLVFGADNALFGPSFRGPGLRRFETFEDAQWQARYGITAGLGFRF